MLRRLLLAVLLCLSAWTVADRVAPDAVEAGVQASIDVPSDATSDGDHSDGAWRAPQPIELHAVGASATRDLHVVVVDLPRVSRREDGRLARLRHSSHRPTPSRPPHLHDIPLLI
ncbi:MAG TPA: hypothetical protein VMF13_17495 [Luteitalea sp.]|nr:hypothetical protein [Luteitalea sp.]